MSEEEKQAIKKFENLLTKHFEDKKIDTIDYLDYFEGITILNLIEKQQKEIEELKHDNSILCEIAYTGKRIQPPYTMVYTGTDNFISKDKIKEKIEERNKWLQEYDEQEEMNELQKDDYRLIKVERNILQSLLEKE